MRTGVLSDSQAAKYEPLPFIANERHFAVAHVHKTTRVTKHRKDDAKPTIRPRAAYLAHYEYSQLMNPLNPTQHMEAFAAQMEAAIDPKPTQSYKQVVQDFRQQYSSFSAFSNESAYMLQRLGISSDQHEPNASKSLPKYIHKGSAALQPDKMRASTPQYIYERLMRTEKDAQAAKKYQEVLDAAMEPYVVRQISPPPASS